MRIQLSVWLPRIFLVLLAGMVSATAGMAFLLEWVGVPPRSLAPYIEKRVSQHNPVIVQSGNRMAQVLMQLDRRQGLPYIPPARIGVQQGFHQQRASSLSAPGTVQVASPEQALKAIAQARPGEVITFAPGTYRFRGQYIAVARAGEKERRITVRAERPDTVVLELDLNEGFLVSAPYWTFENLTFRGICRVHSDCEHAFHIVGDAHHFIARNNKIIDFNAHFKINGMAGRMPDHGLIETNILSNSSVRQTGNPVTPIDLVAASGWLIRRNFIDDFIKGGGNRISFGAFAKGAGADSRFVQNIVICENRLKGTAGQRVGISLGGGGTGGRYCRDGRCITEQEGGVIESNLIASCSDDGIYLNRSAGSAVRHNTLIDTGGIVVRFPESSADVEGNIVDGSIRSRDEGILRKFDNLEDMAISAYVGRHPVRKLYEDVGSFTWKGAAPRRHIATHPPLDLCSEQRPSHPVYGAFEQFSACFPGPH